MKEEDRSLGKRKVGNSGIGLFVLDWRVFPGKHCLKDWTQAWNVPLIIYPVALIRYSFCLLSYFLCLSVAALHQFYNPLCNNSIIALAECLEGKPE